MSDPNRTSRKPSDRPDSPDARPSFRRILRSLVRSDAKARIVTEVTIATLRFPERGLIRVSGQGIVRPAG